MANQGALPQQNYAPGYPGQPPAPSQNYGQQYAQPPQQQAAPQYAQPQYAPPAQPQAYAPQQPVVRQQAQPPLNDPRYATLGNYDAAPTARPTQPVQPSQYPPAYTPPPAPSAYVPESTTRPPQQQRTPSPYDQQWQQHAPQQNAHAHSVPAVDPHGYDLGHYQPSATPEPRTQRPTAPPAWTPHAEPEARQHAPAPGFAPQLQGDLHAPKQSLEPVHDDEYEEHEDDEEYEEAPRKTRYGLIAASLLAAIAAGGGLAYAYKAFVAPATQSAAAPVIKSNTGPIKVKPVDPGGTKFANADSKMMENLSGSSDSNADGGPKAVKTMVIERDGTVASAQSGAPPPQASQAPAASVGVPGMILANVPPPRPPQTAPPAAMAAVVNPPAVQQQVPRVAAKVIAAAPAAAAYPDDPVEAAPAAAPAAAAKKVAPKKITPAAGPAPTAAPSAVGGPKGGNGFVAVLASVPASGSSRVEAMQQYADLQQKFGGVLGSKAPDVVEAKLPNGVYHRLIVGPPASRDSATTICSQLKAAGYTADCWVTTF